MQINTKFDVNSKVYCIGKGMIVHEAKIYSIETSTSFEKGLNGVRIFYECIYKVKGKRGREKTLVERIAEDWNRLFATREEAEEHSKAMYKADLSFGKVYLGI